MKKKVDSIWIFVAVAMLAMGSAIFILPAVLSAPPAQAGEFPADWFAPSQPEEQEVQSKLIGKPMPSLDLSQWRNGEVKPDSLKGKVVFLDFWATWCAPCIAAFPDNSKLHAELQSKGLEAIGICTSAPQTDYDKVLDSKKPTYPMARDEKQMTAKAFGVETFPTYIVVDRKGIVRAVGLKHEYVRQAIEKLLAEPH